MICERDQVAKGDQWDLEALYPSFEDWKNEFETIRTQKNSPFWPELGSFKNRLQESPEAVKSCLEQIFEISRKLSKLYTYAHLKHDEDVTEDVYKKANNEISSAMHDFYQEIAWVEPTLIALPEEKIQEYLNSPLLKPYRFHIEKIVRIKKHTLSPDQEQLMALASKALQTPHKAFGAINDADFKFGQVLDSKGEKRELTHGSYGIYLRDQDRTLRANAFKQMHLKYLDYENTLCELLNGAIQGHVFDAKAHHYNSCLEAALFPKNIEPEVYHALIKAVHSKIGHLHRYVKLRKKILGVDELHLYDMYVPLLNKIDIRKDYKEAEELVIESVAPLGSEYQNILKKGLKEEMWVDRYENKNKHSGAYSGGCYDSHPYILMNYKNLLRDVFTLAHEAGHSMHSNLSRDHQPYHYSDYPIFLAEVASTFNEELLMRLMQNKASSKEEKIFLVNEKIEDIRGTLFRQTMFAEFELKIHEMAEKNIPLTPKSLKEIYHQLNQFYYGDTPIIDSEIDIEWARIPHFYFNFYVFQYATGISAALALAEKLVQGGNKEREDYLHFLKAGSSRYPIELLEMAGVNMRSPLPVEAAITEFGDLVDELAQLLNVEL
jgi:oligoendopeptidase F